MLDAIQHSELTGDPVTVAARVGIETTALGGFSASFAGHVALRATDPPRWQLTWCDKNGSALNTAAAPDANGLSYAELSPDGRFVAAQRHFGSGWDIWQLDLARGSWSRFTRDPTNEQLPVWSPTGRGSYSVSRDGRFLMNELVGASADVPITMMLNWAARGVPPL